MRQQPFKSMLPNKALDIWAQKLKEDKSLLTFF